MSTLQSPILLTVRCWMQYFRILRIWRRTKIIGRFEGLRTAELIQEMCRSHNMNRSATQSSQRNKVYVTVLLLNYNRNWQRTVLVYCCPSGTSRPLCRAAAVPVYHRLLQPHPNEMAPNASVSYLTLPQGTSLVTLCTFRQNSWTPLQWCSFFY